MSTPLLLVFLAAASANDETATLDIARYAGTWYELARYDHFFERGCEGVTATYTTTPKGELEVVNRCLKGGLKGPVKTIEGKAWVPDAKTPGRLKVQFFWPFYSDYWVLGVDPDYRWALRNLST